MLSTKTCCLILYETHFSLPVHPFSNCWLPFLYGMSFCTPNRGILSFIWISIMTLRRYPSQKKSELIKFLKLGGINILMLILLFLPRLMTYEGAPAMTVRTNLNARTGFNFFINIYIFFFYVIIHYYSLYL